MCNSKHPADTSNPSPVRGTASATIAAAISELEIRGIRFTRPNEHQLKIGRVNFYPGTGTIHLDGTRKARRNLALHEAIVIIARYGV